MVSTATPWMTSQDGSIYKASPDFAERRVARIERLQARADRLRGEAERLNTHAGDMASVIPFGQPILVGHHSEGRDRNYRARIRRTWEKAAAMLKDAKDADQRATAAEANTAIFSDDPTAAEQIREKIAALEAKQVQYTQINRLARLTNRQPT